MREPRKESGQALMVQQLLREHVAIKAQASKILALTVLLVAVHVVYVDGLIGMSRPADDTATAAFAPALQADGTVITTDGALALGDGRYAASRLALFGVVPGAGFQVGDAMRAAVRPGRGFDRQIALRTQAGASAFGTFAAHVLSGPFAAVGAVDRAQRDIIGASFAFATQVAEMLVDGLFVNAKLTSNGSSIAEPRVCFSNFLGIDSPTARHMISVSGFYMYNTGRA